MPLNNPAIFDDPDAKMSNSNITPQEFYLLKDQPITSDEDYATRMTYAVNQVMVHYWYPQGMERYNLRIPAHENWILYLIYSWLPVDDLKMYEFCDYKKALDRGVGFCSQQSFVLDSILDEQGIESNILEFPYKHVVVTSRLQTPDGDAWWILDPDFGVVIEEDIETIQRDSSKIIPYYIQAGYDVSELSYLIEAYSSDYERHLSVADYFSPEKCDLERISYWIRWVLPLTLLIAGSYPTLRSKIIGKS